MSIRNSSSKKPRTSHSPKEDKSLHSRLPWTPHFILYHKPKGILVTRKDEKQRTTVYDALPLFFLEDGWVPIGRLDKLSRGLLLFTQVGELVDLLTQPGLCEKYYDIVIRGRISDANLSDAQTGIPSDLGLLKVHQVKKIREIGPKTYLQVILKEGKNRHLRRLFHSFKDPHLHTPLKVLDLKRNRIGTLSLGDLPAGGWRFITASEERQLLRSVKNHSWTKVSAITGLPRTSRFLPRNPAKTPFD